jgi:hypothetical protein
VFLLLIPTQSVIFIIIDGMGRQAYTNILQISVLIQELGARIKIRISLGDKFTRSGALWQYVRCISPCLSLAEREIHWTDYMTFDMI